MKERWSKVESYLLLFFSFSSFSSSSSSSFFLILWKFKKFEESIHRERTVVNGWILHFFCRLFFLYSSFDFLVSRDFIEYYLSTYDTNWVKIILTGRLLDKKNRGMRYFFFFFFFYIHKSVIPSYSVLR